MHKLGLIGYPLSHSFSKKYFSEKFKKEGISGFEYDLYPLETIDALTSLLEQEPELLGINVTIPYKEQVIPFLDELDAGAAAIGAVNTIIIGNGQKKGFNTDVYGFELSLRKMMKKAAVQPERALVLGTGGASKAIVYALEQLGITPALVSRREGAARFTYAQLTPEVIAEHQLIVNTTPLGTSPNTEFCPDLPYEALTGKHLLYDLVYNPEVTLFLKKGLEKGASIQNGLEMLHLQAEKAWEIWTDFLNTK